MPGEQATDDVAREIAEPGNHVATCRIEFMKPPQRGGKSCLSGVGRQVRIVADTIEDKRVERVFVPHEPTGKRVGVAGGDLTRQVGVLGRRDRGCCHGGVHGFVPAGGGREHKL